MTTDDNTENIPPVITKQKRTKGPNKFRLAKVTNDGIDVENLLLTVFGGRVFPSTAAVRVAAEKDANAGEYCAVLIRDRFTVAVETPEPVPVVTVKSVKV